MEKIFFLEFKLATRQPFKHFLILWYDGDNYRSIGARHVKYDAQIYHHYIHNTVCMPTITNTVKMQNQYSLKLYQTNLLFAESVAA
jgi:hypothetical protein